MEKTEQPLQICNNLLFPKIFQTFRIAIQPSKLIIAFIAIALICLAGWLMDFSKTVVMTSTNTVQQMPMPRNTYPNRQIPGRTPRMPYSYYQSQSYGLQSGGTELDIYLANPANPGVLKGFINSNKENGQRTGVFNTLWHFTETRFQSILNSMFKLDMNGIVANITDFFKALTWAFSYHIVYCLIFLIIKLAVIGFAGGAICRLAALQFAKGEKPGLTEAIHFSRKRFFSLFTAPLIPVAIISFIGLLIFIAGLIGNIPFAGELIVGLTIPLTLIAGALISLIAIGLIAGFNLMFPAIAYDGSDAFDSISRSFSYVYAKPWRMAIYCLIAAIYGAICYTFVRLFAFILLYSAHIFLQLGVMVKSSNQASEKLEAIWPQPEFFNLLFKYSSLENLSRTESVAAFLIYLSVLFVVGVIISFVISFFFSANTIIYSLLRKQVDKTSLNDIYNHSDVNSDLKSAIISKTNPAGETAKQSTSNEQ